MIEAQKRIARLRAILSVGLDRPEDTLDLQGIESEVQMLCGDLLEMYGDKALASKDSEVAELEGYFDSKLFAMKSAVRAAIGFDRDGASEKTIRENFEHFSHIVEGMLQS